MIVLIDHSDCAVNNRRLAALVSFDYRRPIDGWVRCDLVNEASTNSLIGGELNPCLSSLQGNDLGCVVFRQVLHVDLQWVRSSLDRIMLIAGQSSVLIKQPLGPCCCSRPASCLTFVDVEKSWFFSDKKGFFVPISCRKVADGSESRVERCPTGEDSAASAGCGRDLSC